MIGAMICETAAPINHLVRRVLVVDDEEPIRLLLTEYFEMVGVEVQTARSGLEGLEALEREAFDLVLCDVAMPGLDGFEVFDRVRQFRPEQNFMFISGYAFAGAKRKLLQKSLGFLPKPFHLEDLNLLMETLYPDLL